MIGSSAKCDGLATAFSAEADYWCRRRSFEAGLGRRDFAAIIGFMPSQRATVALFDRIARFYARSALLAVPIRALHQAALAVAIEQAPAAVRILDVGCGPGLLLGRAARVFPSAELVGVDPAPGMLREAERTLGEAGGGSRQGATGGGSGHDQADDRRIRFIEGFAQSLPLPDQSFDLVLGSLTLHHWEEQETGLREVQRVLEPGGLLVLAVVQAVGWLSGPLRLIGWRDRIKSPAETDAQLKAAGLAPVYRRRLRWSANSLQVVACRPDRKTS